MSHEEKDYIQILHSRGYRVTPQRLIVLDAVCELAGHATIKDIQAKVYDMDPTIDRSTIYRVLKVLIEVGLVVDSEMGEEGRIYRIAGEARHHHLVCQSCGNIQTIEDNVLAPVIKAMHEKYGFLVIADHITLKGICATCAGF